MNGADVADAEEVRQVRRNGREPAAVHGQDHAEDRDEQREAAARAGGRRRSRRGRCRAQRRSRRSSSGRSDPTARPRRSAADVEQAQKPGESRRRRSGDPALERSPESSATPCRARRSRRSHSGTAPPTAARTGASSTQRSTGTARPAASGGAVPRDVHARRRPARRRQAIAERAGHHRGEVDRAEHDERLPHADRRGRRKPPHQRIGERRADHRAAAESHDGETGRHAATIRKPLDERRHGRDVTETQSASAEHARPEPEQPDLVQVDADGGNHEPAAPAAGRDDAGFARPFALDPGAEQRGRRAEEHEEQRVHPAERADLPVVRRGTS